MITPEQRDAIWTRVRDLDDPVSKEVLEVLLDELTESPKVLTSAQILRLGALTVEQDQLTALGKLLDAQERTYRETLATEGAEPLIAALLDRDTQLAHLGRQVADGKTAGRLLREFMRMALQGSDHASLTRIGDATKAGKIEEVLGILSGQPADARQLKLHGSTLGALEGPEAAAAKAEEKWARAKAQEWEEVKGGE